MSLTGRHGSIGDIRYSVDPSTGSFRRYQTVHALRIYRVDSFVISASRHAYLECRGSVGAGGRRVELGGWGGGRSRDVCERVVGTRLMDLMLDVFS
jgi:hypothetical protein